MNELLIYKFKILLIILARLLGMIAVAPVFSSTFIPMRYKGILALLIAVMCYPMLSQINFNIPADWGMFAFVIAGEIIIGIAIGFIIAVIFVIFQLAGQFFSLQMGFGISQVFDPLFQIQIPLIGQFQALFGTYVFISVGGPQLLIYTVYQSYFKVPSLNMMEMSGPISKAIIDTFSDMFIIALQLGLPVIGTVLIVTVCLGLLAKFAPQMNIMMVGFPIYIVVGFITLFAIMPFFISKGADILNQYFNFLIYELF